MYILLARIVQSRSCFHMFSGRIASIDPVVQISDKNMKGYFCCLCPPCSFMQYCCGIPCRAYLVLVFTLVCCLGNHIPHLSNHLLSFYEYVSMGSQDLDLSGGEGGCCSVLLVFVLC